MKPQGRGTNSLLRAVRPAAFREKTTRKKRLADRARTFRKSGVGCPETHSVSGRGEVFFLTSPFIGHCYRSEAQYYPEFWRGTALHRNWRRGKNRRPARPIGNGKIAQRTVLTSVRTRPRLGNPCPCFPPKLVAASFVQRLMHQANRRRSFADCRRHALHVARAHIANRKHAGQTGLENIRSAPQRPACAGEIFRRQIWSSLDEALLILNNTSFEPSRVRASSGHHENVPDVVSL